MIFIIPIILILIGYAKYDFPQKKNKGDFLWGVIYVVLVLIIGLRYKVGGDTYNYMTYFLWIPEIRYWQPFDSSSFEPGFSFITSVIKTLTDNIYIYQTIISAVMTIMLMDFINRHTEYRFLALLVVYVAVYPYFSTEIVRESLAVCGLLVSYDYLKDKKYLQYFIVCLLLTTIHSSAVVTFLFPIIRHLKFDKRMLIYGLSVVFLGFFMPRFMDVLAHKFFVFEKLLRYSSQGYVGYLWCGFRFLYFSLLPILVLLICKNNYKLTCQFEGIICFQILLGLGLWFVPIVFQRLINYTIVFYIVSMVQMLGTVMRDPDYWKHFNRQVVNARIGVAKMIIWLTLLAHSSYYIHLNFYKRYIPYHSVFNPIEVPERENFVAGNE